MLCLWLFGGASQARTLLFTLIKPVSIQAMIGANF
jgi:hypothetical protein